MEIEGRRRFRVRLNLVPLINVIFLLLIFFMLAGTIQSPEPFDLEIPQSRSGDSGAYEPSYEPVEIAVGAEGQIALNGEEIAARFLPEALKEQFAGDASPIVSLKVDARADTGEMVDILRELRAVGARLVFIETRPLPTE